MESRSYWADFVLEVLIATVVCYVALVLMRYLREKRGVRVRYLALLLVAMIPLVVLPSACLSGIQGSGLVGGFAGICGGYLLNELNRGKWRL